MDNKVVIAIIVAAILVVAGYLAYSGGATVSAQGVSSIKVTPDEVSVNINIETTNLTAQDAQAQNKIISDALLTALIKLGFDRDELKFVNYNVYQQYDWNNGQQKSTGYTVSQQLVVKTNQTDEVPSIVDAAINSGALVSYIDFEVSDAKQKDIKAQALEEASKDARTKAGAIASGQGKSLGRLVSLQNQDFNYPGPLNYYTKSDSVSAGAAGQEARTAALNISPQEQDISASVVASYKLGFF